MSDSAGTNNLVYCIMVLALCIVDVSPPIACHGGTRGSLFGLQRMQNSIVNVRDSRFILVRTLDRDRVIALCPVGVSLCVGLIVSVVSRNPALLYIVRRPES